MGRIAVTSDGVRVAFDVAGSGPPVLFVHGLGDDRGVWASVVDRLRGRYTCVALDLRGHGETEGAADFDPFGLVRDLAAVTRSLGFSHPLVVGHSLGGFAATVYAAGYDVCGVVNVDQPLDLSSLASSVRELERRLRAGEVSEVLWTVLESIGLGPLEPETVHRLRATRAKLSASVVLGVWHPLLRSVPGELAAAVDQVLARIRVPYFAWHGREPRPSYRTWLKRRAPRAEVVVWDGVGHFPHLADPARFAEQIDAWAQLVPPLRP